jgi:hypothetical protein
MINNDGGAQVPQPEEAGVQVNVGYAVALGPDGQPWAQLQIMLGLTQYVMVIPERTARELAELIPRQLVAAADEVRRARSGLIVPSTNGGPVQMTQDQLRNLVGG